MESRPRILLLEDEGNWVHLITLLLSDEYDVVPAADLEAARDLVSSSVFHLAIVDISLVPGNRFDEDGLQFIEDLRVTEILRDMSIIVVSGYPRVHEAETPDRVRVAFRELNVVDFFDKSRFDRALFVQTVAKAVADSYPGSVRGTAY